MQPKALFSDTQLMTGVKNIIAVSHKGGHVFPSAHHPAEAKTFYADFEKAIPAGVKLFEISGHNHNPAAAPTKGLVCSRQWRQIILCLW